MAKIPYTQLSSSADHQIPYQQIEAPTQGTTTIPEDILASLYAVPGAITEGLVALPREVYESAKQIVTDPTRASENIVAGLIQPGKYLADLPSNIAGYLGRKGVISPEVTQRVQSSPLSHSPLSQRDIKRMTGLEGPAQPGDLGLQSISYVPFGMAGEAGTLGALGRGAARGTTAALYSAGANQNPVTGAIAVPLSGGIGQGLMRVPGKVKATVAGFSPSSRLTGQLSNEEVAQNLRAAQGTSAFLGDVMGSPKLKKFYENTVAPIWGSGSDEAYKKLADELQAKGEVLVGQDIPVELGQTHNDLIKSKLLDAASTHRKIKNEKYGALYKLAEEEKFRPKLNDFALATQDITERLGPSPLAEMIGGYGKLAKTARRMTGTGVGLPGGQETLDILGPLTLKEAGTLKSDLYNKGKNYLASSVGSERNLAHEYFKLHNALNKDIKNSLENDASPELHGKYQDAMRYYSDDFSRFLDRDLRKYFSDDEPSDAIVQNIVRPSRKLDKTSTLVKILDILPREDQEAIGKAYLKNSLNEEGKVDVNKLHSLIKALGPQQFNTLFQSPELRQQVKDFHHLKGMSGEALSRLVNPRTGYRSHHPAITAALAALGAAGGTQAGGIPGAIAGATLASMGPGMFAKYMTQYLTSPRIRESLGKKVMQKQEPPRGKDASFTALAQGAPRFIEALIAQQQGEGE